ncbi:hypothetical protein D3C78_1103150 [compost metagenome]
MWLTSKFYNMKKTLEKLNLDIKDVLSVEELKSIKGGKMADCDYAGNNYCINMGGDPDACAKANCC